jgi:hypothetical protein
MTTRSPADDPEDPKKVDYGSTHPPIVRSAGGTPSEQYLAKLGDRSFLNLWSYPNTFINKKAAGKGDGKELCDLLVVCGDHVLIFSDKTVGWPSGDDEQLAWKRWFKRAVAKSVDQIRGAERWIAQFPDKIFLDRQCTCPLPLQLPPLERRKVHGIVVALGAGDACKRYFGEGTGSLFLAPDIKGDAHWKADHVAPFVIGDVDPEGSFVHVLDDATLNIVMRELDTITDLTAYLGKKEHLVRSGRLISAAGEEELLAYYMTHLNSRGEHDFTKPDGSNFSDNDRVGFETGFYSQLLTNPQYRAKKLADQNSYVWDRLIETFTTNMLAGTTIIPNGEPFVLSHLEEGIRYMAITPRRLRRILGDAILDAWQKGSTTDRFTRAFIPGTTERDRETGYFFMTLASPKIELAGGYEQYRSVRRNMLETYALALLQKYPGLKQVVGITTEPPNEAKKGGSSEDLIVIRPGEWTPQLLQDLEERKKLFEIIQEGRYKEYTVQGIEFPEGERRHTELASTKLTRRQRRAKTAEARRQKRKDNKQR